MIEEYILKMMLLCKRIKDWTIYGIFIFLVIFLYLGWDTNLWIVIFFSSMNLFYFPILKITRHRIEWLMFLLSRMSTYAILFYFFSSKLGFFWLFLIMVGTDSFFYGLTFIVFRHIVNEGAFVYKEGEDLKKCVELFN